MPPSALSGSPPSLGSPSKTSSCHSRSLVFEQGGPSEKVPVVDLSSSSHEEGLIPGTSRDEEFAKRLFDDLNRDILGNSDEEEEVHEEKIADAEAAPSATMWSPASTASADADDTPTRAKNDNSDDRTPDQEADGGNDGVELT
jgi:hypothetical protein